MSTDGGVDTEYEETTLSKVRDHGDCWELYREDGGCISCPKVPGFTPRAGMRAKFYGRGFGYRVRGIVIENVVHYYRSELEDRVENERQLADHKREQRKKWEDNLAAHEAQVAALPSEFRARIARFRRVNPEFWQQEPYELFCCEQAVVIARALGSVKAIDEWNGLPYDSQYARIPELSHDHSGNTFGTARILARLWLSQPELIEKMHGALCPLVGCKDYGCYAATQDPPKT